MVNLGAVGVGGGTINTTRVQKTGGSTATATFNFHGGTLKALPAANATFFTGLTSSCIWNEGGTIDNSGLNLTIGQALLSPVAGTGVTTLSVTGGTGYINTPFVTVTGGTVAAGGLAATAVANINYATGQITGVTITNPGNYSSTTGLGLIQRRRWDGSESFNIYNLCRHRRCFNFGRHGYDYPYRGEHVFRGNDRQSRWPQYK